MQGINFRNVVVRKKSSIKVLFRVYLRASSRVSVSTFSISTQVTSGPGMKMIKYGLVMSMDK